MDKVLSSRWLWLAAPIALALVHGTPAVADAEITFATEGSYPPWNERLADGELTGFDVDLTNALCRTIAKRCDIVTATFPGMMDTLADGGYDAIISGIAITARREEKIAFSRPYMSLSVSFATATGSPLAKDAPASNAGLLERLAAARLGAQTATANAKLIEALLPDATLITFGDQEALNRAVAKGVVDAGLAATETWKNPVPAKPNEVIAIGEPLTSTDYPLLGEGLGIGVGKDATDLKDALDDAICKLTTDETVARLSKIWFDADLSVSCN